VLGNDSDIGAVHQTKNLESRGIDNRLIFCHLRTDTYQLKMQKGGKSSIREDIGRRGMWMDKSKAVHMYWAS